MIFTPHDYQKVAIQEIKSKQSTGLLLDMGLGKTVITLTAIADLIALEDIKKVLVVAPLQTAKSTWGTELSKWNHLSGLSMSLVVGSLRERVDALSKVADIYVINRENIQWLCDYLSDWPFDMLVIDELSSFKSSSSKRFKALRKKLPYVRRVVGLTGTPASNGYMDLWSEIYLLDRGARLGRTIGIYRQAYFYPAKSNNHIVYDWKLNAGAKDLIDNKISDICVSMKAVDFLNMPDRIETDIYVEMDDKESKVYKQFGRDHILPEQNVVGINAATVQGKLLQMANGFVYDDNKNIYHIHDRKLEALSELVEAANQRPMIVYYSFVADKDKILTTFPKAKELRGPSEVIAWNRGEISILLAHPASAGHGLNLQDGGNIMVWYGLPWSLELYQQANARLYRQGQKQTVYIYHILTKDTHDLDVLNALKRKNINQEELLRALKARIKKWTEEG